MKKHFIALLGFAVILAGCGDTSGSGSANGAGGSGDGLKVGIVFDSGGRGDKSFNDSAYAGLEMAEKELGVKGKTVDSKSEKDYETNLSALASSGTEVVIAVGLAQQNALKVVAPKFPDVKFAIVDAIVEQPNVRSLVFTEEQGSFLAGYAAGLATKSNRIGFVGGMSIPLIEKFEAGFVAGARTANPQITVLPAKYTESWEDVGLGKAAAKVLFDQGADVVYHAAGRAGLGVIDAARESGKYAIGVDSDQDDEAKGTVLTSMVKRVDQAVFQTIKDVKEGKFDTGTRAYTLADQGVGLTDFRNTKDKFGEANIAKVEEIKAKIVSGEIKVPTTRQELAAFQAPR